MRLGLILGLIGWLMVTSSVLAQRSSTCIPPSIMLHSKDRYVLVEKMIPWLSENGYVTLTYRDFGAILRGERVMPEKAILLSIDDVTPRYINGYFVEMIESLHNAGMVATIGVNDQVALEEAPEAYARLAIWASWGMELATHTTDHANLPVYSDEMVVMEIAGSVDRIQYGTGYRPTTLILPYGAGGNDQRVYQVSASTGIQFIVGIKGTNRNVSVMHRQCMCREYRHRIVICRM